MFSLFSATTLESLPNIIKFYKKKLPEYNPDPATLPIKKVYLAGHRDGGRSGGEGVAAVGAIETVGTP